MGAGDKIIDGLVASSDLSKELMHPGQDIKPCVAQMIENSFVKGDYPDRNTVALIISSELRRIGCTYEEVLFRVERWNNGNFPPLKYSEYSKAVKNAFAKDYRYGCNNSALQMTCIENEMCPFFTKVLSKRKTYNNRIFYRYHWPEILLGVANPIYHMAIVELEKIRQVGAGGTIYTSQREISKLAGICRKSARKGLERLRDVGLIEYEPGTPRKWEGKASKIRRVIPIPKPSVNLQRKLVGKNDAT